MGDTVAIAVAVAMLVTACAQPPARGDELRSIAAVDALPEAALVSRPVATLRGRIIAVIEAAGGAEAILEDDSGGIRLAAVAGTVDEGSSAAAGDLVPGDVVEVRAVVEAGPDGRILRPQRIARLGSEPLPTPRPCDVTAFFEGREECRLVAVEGIVENVWHDGTDLLLEVQVAGRLFTAVVPAEVAAAIAEIDDGPLVLIDAVVQVAGPATKDANARGEIVRPRIRVDRPAWFTIVEPAASGLVFSNVAVAPDAIGRSRPQTLPGHRVYTFGQVVHAEPRRRLFLQNGHYGIEVRLATGGVGTEVHFEPGDRVEVAGFVDRSGSVASIRNASVRRIEAGPPPTPLLATPELILAANGGAVTPEMMPAPGDYQGCLVRCTGTLVQSQPAGEGGTLLVDASGVVVSVEADEATFAALAATPPRSRVRIDGVALVDRAPASGDGTAATPQRLRLLLRAPDDFLVLEAPPWWTTIRLMILLGATVAILVAAVGWAVTLRRQLATQTQLLAQEMRSRRDAALEFEATLRERNRLAANLHDTLQQTIAGIGFQLDACGIDGARPDAVAGRHLSVARRMVNHAAKELQGSVWAMRSLPLDGKPFGDALRALVSRVCEGYDVQPTVRADAALSSLPEFVAGSVLLIVQEAVHNALKHARPSRIEVHVADDADDGLLTVRVEDDGSGFRTGAQPGPREGHFGIQGMRERAERLGGRLLVRQRPGGGTIVEATVQRRDYDDALHTPPVG